MATDFLRPDADSVDGNWTTGTGSTSLFDAVDEASASDADYIRSGPSPINDTCRLRLSNPPGPTPIQPMSVHYRYRKTGAGVVNLRVQLIQGASTVIAEANHANISSSYVNGTMTLTTPQFNAITDFNDLFLQLTANPVAFILDEISATALSAYGFRKMRSAYAGSAVQLRNVGGTLLDVGFDLTGDFDVAAAAAHGASTIATWYDQSGNGRSLSQISVSSQPAYSATGLNGRPTAVFSGSAVFMRRSTYPMGTSNMAAAAVVLEVTTGAIDNGRIVGYDDAVGGGDVTGGIFAVYRPGPDRFVSYRDGGYRGQSPTISLDVPCTMFSEYNGSAPIIYVNNVVGSNLLGYGTNFPNNGILLLGAADGGAAAWKGKVSEFIMFSGANVSSGDRGIIHNSQNIYFLS